MTSTSPTDAWPDGPPPAASATAGDVTELRAALDAAMRSKQEELGRLEAGAMAALERTIDRFSTRMALLEERLREARAEADDLRTQVQEATLARQHLERMLSKQDHQLHDLADEIHEHEAGPHRGT